MQIENFRIWNGTMPYKDPADSERTEHTIKKEIPDGIDRYTDITEPTLTFFPAPAAGPNPAVLICPGGGYNYIAWNSEGSTIASLLNVNGFSAFALKYRCPGQRQAAFADGARAMRYIRFNAEKFHIDPKRLGGIGFSAGGHLTARLSATATEPYPAQDEVDSLSFRPDFTVLVYPAYLVDEKNAVSPEFKMDSTVPPTLLIQAENDGVRVENSIFWYFALKQAGVPAEMHLYAEGGHGFALRRTGFPISNWGILAADWLRRQASEK